MGRPIGEQLREARKAAGLDQNALAAKIGIGQGSVSHIEKGTRDPSIDVIERWLQACGLEFQIIAPAGPPPGLRALISAVHDGAPDRAQFLLDAAALLARIDAEDDRSEVLGLLRIAARRQPPHERTLLALRRYSRLRTATLKPADAATVDAATAKTAERRKARP